MRGIALALLLLVGCDRDGDDQPTVEGLPAAVSFEGADSQSAAGRIMHGDRMAWVLGCRGCHGQDLKGQLWDDDPREYGVMWASNLTRAIPEMSDTQLRDLITKGKHPRRSDLWVMPSELFQHLSEHDLDALIAYLRTLRAEGETSPDPRPGPKALRELASGKIKPAATLVAELRAVGPPDLGPQHALGRYITQVACAECHGTKLQGVPNDTPDLIVVGGYSRDEFEKLITTGVPIGNRELKELMQDVAKNRYSRLTGKERDALYAYLRARAELSQ